MGRSYFEVDVTDDDHGDLLCEWGRVVGVGLGVMWGEVIGGGGVGRCGGAGGADGGGGGWGGGGGKWGGGRDYLSRRWR